ncbi:hypothetical protein EYF80_028693 [Liparis tanakae]|uniref:Uncharacterized protein n=1 Tax=Liparis tanakae TaxID=230148 RepID=A0A4Z2H693_9TELE|nr:hypothetical protein EYF80_028693 [Liparis tanakae]
MGALPGLWELFLDYGSSSFALGSCGCVLDPPGEEVLSRSHGVGSGSDLRSSFRVTVTSTAGSLVFSILSGAILAA